MPRQPAFALRAPKKRPRLDGKAPRTPLPSSHRFRGAHPGGRGSEVPSRGVPEGLEVAAMSPPCSTSPRSKRAAGFVPSITPGVAIWACWPHPAALSPSPESGSAFTPRDLKPRLSQGHPEAGSHFGDFFSAAEAELLLGDWRNHKLLLVVSPASGQIPGASRLPKLQNHLWGWQAGPPSITPSPLTRGKSFPTQNASWARAARVHETRKPAAATCLQPSTHPSPS